ncbi:hypothetical protein ACFFX0_25305 [Citricoccus parietis]|uniref:Uncharacterized protein n=1 Tax=Citricoccus parietis TaxID=592307 RepID=A0ABV5G614_9MICC
MATALVSLSAYPWLRSASMVVKARRAASSLLEIAMTSTSATSMAACHVGAVEAFPVSTMARP